MRLGDGSLVTTPHLEPHPALIDIENPYGLQSAGSRNGSAACPRPGKSNFPGLSVWARDGTKMAVTVPDGCLLVQAGKQIEHLTGGHVMAGFHEVQRAGCQNISHL